jgi:hypothetical protein
MTSANLLPAIQSSQLSVPDKIDDKVRRILREIVSFGFLDRPQLDSSIPINDPRSRTTAIDVAREGIVLSQKLLGRSTRVITTAFIRVRFRVTNTGDRAGSETAQLYVAPVNPPVTRPIKELKGFRKVFLQPSESKKVTITLDRRSLAYYDVSAHAWDVARGVYKILVGSSSQDIRLQGTVLNLVPAQLSVLKSKPVPLQESARVEDENDQ